MKAGRIVITVVFLLALTQLAVGQYVSQTVGSAGNIDWSKRVVRATGIGAPNPDHPPAAQRAGAIAAAKAAALRNLLETTKGVYLTSETTVRNAMLENDIIETKVSGIIQGYTVVDIKYMSTADVEVTVEIAVDGDLSNALLGEEFGGATYTGGQPLCPVCGQPWPAGKPVPAGVQLVQPSSQSASEAAAAMGGTFTGLIVDTQGLGVRPAMSPKILDESGQEVYGSKYVSREWAVEQGMVGYDKNINTARANDRVTNNPLIVKALKTSGPNKADVVVSSADAAKIHAAAQNMNFIDKCKVMFIVD